MQKKAQDLMPEMIFLADALANLKDCVDIFCSVSLSRYPERGNVELSINKKKLLSW